MMLIVYTSYDQVTASTINKTCRAQRKCYIMHLAIYEIQDRGVYYFILAAKLANKKCTGPFSGCYPNISFE